MPEQIAFIKYETEFEAMVAIASGLIFFLRKHTYKTAFVLLVLFGFGGYILNDYFDAKGKKADVEVAKPMSNNSTSWILPEAFAASLAIADTIKINGKAYGIKDPNFDVWKLDGKAVFMVHDKINDIVYLVKSSEFDKDKLKQVK